MQGVESVSSEKHQSSSLLKSASLVAVGTLSSRILGLIRDIALAATFPRYVTDAFIVAFRIPNLFRRLFGEGSLSVAFVPIFVELRSKDSSGVDAKKLTSAVFTLLLAILVTILMLGLVFTPAVIGWLTPGGGYQDVPGKVELTISLARIMLSFVLLVCIYAYFMAILNSLKRFAAPAFAPMFVNIAIIVGVYLPEDWFSFSGESLAWAVLVGGVLQLVIVIPSLVKSGFFPQVRFQWNYEPVLRVLRKMGPSLIGLGILQLNIIVNTRFASFLPEGANSWIFWADRLLEFPLSLFAVSIGTVLLPTLSEYWSKGKIEAMSELTNKSLRSMLFLAIPSGVGLYLLASPIVETVFMRGEFDQNDVSNTALVLKIYGLAIFTYGSIRVLQPAFYATQNTWLPAVVSASSLGLHIILAGQWIGPYGIEGLAASSATSAAFNMTLLFLFYRKFIGPLGMRTFFLGTLKLVVAASVMMLALLGFSKFVDPSVSFAGLFIHIVFGFIVYVFIAKLLNVPELEVLNRIKRKIS